MSEDTTVQQVAETAMPAPPASKIAELNGRWAVLLKVTLVAIPVGVTLMSVAVFPWVVWVTTWVFSIQQVSTKVESIDADLVRVSARVELLPPEEWKERIRNLEADAKQNLTDHTQILISLEQIKGAVGVKPTP